MNSQKPQPACGFQILKHCNYNNNNNNNNTKSHQSTNLDKFFLSFCQLRKQLLQFLISLLSSV